MDFTQDPGKFDPAQWFNRVGPFLPDPTGVWVTRDVIGPRDACWVLKMREMIRRYYLFGPPVPVDMFLLSLGEAPHRDCTKIGGLPFWPRGRQWPKATAVALPPFPMGPTLPRVTPAGAPLPFLAQFCFRESVDIIGDTPEDLLLLFGDKDVPWTIVGKWQSSKCRSRLVDCNDIPVASPTPTFWGTPWRTEHLLIPVANSGVTSVDLADGTWVSDLWFICELLGMQISPYPFFPRWGHRPNAQERAVCSLCSVFPRPGQPWPFLNRSEPLTGDEARPLAFDMTHQKDADGFGVVCVVVGDSGEPSVLYENL